MGATDVSAPVARLAAIIGGLSNIGLVHTHDIFDRDDVTSLVVSSIDETDTLRAWWITGPTLNAERSEQKEAGYLRRRWTYTIHGIEGLSSDGDSIATLRDNAVAVADAIDTDYDLNGTCHGTDPCRWTDPVNRRLAAGMICSYVTIEKTVVTLSTPS